MSRLLRVLSVFTVAIALSACAARPGDVLRPVAGSVPGATPLDLLVVTTRERSADEARLFSGERARTTSFADITISIPPEAARTVGEVQWPRSRPPDPSREFATLAATVIDADGAQRRLRERLATRGQGRVLVFVHGFNNRFADAVFGFAQIAHDSRAPAVPILFTWPSRGDALGYGYDRGSAEYSRDALETLIVRLAANPAVRDVAILAHSMGNYLTIETLRQMAIRNGRLPAKLSTVMLAAPDIDVDVFRTQMARIGPQRPRFILFTSRDDRALALSRRLAGGVVRLGEVDARSEPLRSELARERITVVDLTGQGGDDPFRHARFAEVPQVVQAIGVRLSAGQNLNHGEVPASHHVADAARRGGEVIGGVAGLVGSLPFVVLDPEEGERVRRRSEQILQ